MFNVRLKNVRFTKSVLAISFVIIIIAKATASAHLLCRNRREIIDSDNGHSNGDSILSTETTAGDVSTDRVHSIELNNKTNDGRVGVVNISNANTSTTRKYNQNDIVSLNLNGSTTSPSTTLLPSPSTDVNNAIATIVFDASNPNYQHEFDDKKRSQR